MAGTTTTPREAMTARQQPPAARVPPLAPGDHLTRDEFERRYDATEGLKKAELIEGVVYMPPPVSYGQHGNPQFNVVSWLGLYTMGTPGVAGADNSSLRLDLDNMPQPDTCLRITSGGQSRIDQDGYVEGAPELVLEVAPTSASYDLHEKLKVYRRNGVKEYIVWRTFDRAIDWFILREGRYDRLAPDATGVYRSEVLPGLWLDAPALLRGEMQTVARILQDGLASAEHTTFAERLKATMPTPTR